jgi:hypothetical protein
LGGAQGRGWGGEATDNRTVAVAPEGRNDDSTGSMADIDAQSVGDASRFTIK